MAKEKPAKAESGEKSAGPNFKRYLIVFWTIVATPFLVVLLWLLGIIMFADLPKTEDLLDPKSNLASVIYSADGKELGKYFKENRVEVKYKDLDPDLVHALVATEDERFYDHSGVDFRGLMRVLFKTVIGGDEGSGGGSTISQQLAKMLFPRDTLRGPVEKINRKMKEWIIATRIERLYTKEEIITMYLNKFDFGHLAVGIKSAARIYFNTTPDSLKVEEAAMLIGMCQNPSKWNPIRFPDKSKDRRNTVLAQMRKNKYITDAEFAADTAKPLALNFHPEDHNEGLATYFRETLRTDFLKTWCNENLKPDGTKYNIYKDGLKIYTTIDSRMQRYAEEAMTQHMKDLQGTFDKRLKGKKNSPFSYRATKDEINSIMESAMWRSDRAHQMIGAGNDSTEIRNFFKTKKIPMTIFSWKGERDTTMTPWDSIRYYKSYLQAGFMAMEPQTGYIRAWVGGVNYRYFKYDHVKVGKRQVGSTFKPFVYALAIQEGWSPCTKVPNVRTCIPTPAGTDWCPDNSDHKLEGQMLTLKKALANSVNFVTAYIMKTFGPEAVVKFAQRVGITSKLDPVPSLCLGTADISLYEMVGANSTFANKGTWIEPTYVTRIEDKNGKVLYEKIPDSHEALDEQKAYVMLNLMQGVVESGTGHRLRGTYKLMNPIAGKTGTTQNNSDGWFMGLTPDLVAGAWVGAEDRDVHFDNTSEGQGASMALPIWAYFFKKVYADKSLKVSKGDFDKPSKKLQIDLNCKDTDDDTGGDPNDGYDPSADPLGLDDGQ